MTEPTLGTASTAAIGALFVAIIGIEPQALVWGLVGAVFGMAFAPQSGRLRAALVFAAVALASGLLGTWAADFWHEGSKLARNGYSLGIAVAFHPLLATFVQAVPAVLQSLIKARTGSDQ